MEPTLQQQFIEQLKTRAVLKKNVFDKTVKAFAELKEVLKSLPKTINPELIDHRVNLEYEDVTGYVAKLKAGGDVLVFYMHTNAFHFDRDHKVWQLAYAKEDVRRTYCGVINIYNFLSDSFRYGRQNDLGYLVARVFLNHEGCFFVEGKRQQSMGLNNFGTSVINKQIWTTIIETAMLYSLEFDLLVPPYDDMKIISLAQMNDEIVQSRLRTGKRLGFVFNSDDVAQ
ncbi:MAG: hypothetical protein LBV41_09190 [Cytophagaceae bacterium]|jgi:hypothetical protein|nr:hypothetical protein [Cytophagaceae bacterium]